MAIFEKQITNKISLDDTEKLTCVIENAHNIDKHTEYSIRVQRGCSKDNTWYVSRRYNDFVVLHAALQLADVALPLPAKKIIGNMQPGFIAARQIGLQAYLDVIMKNNILASSSPVKIFLDPENYSSALSELITDVNGGDAGQAGGSHAEQLVTDDSNGIAGQAGGSHAEEMALQNVSMALRGDGDFELRSPLPNIGWRLRKHYYMVNRGPVKGPGGHVMAWSTYGPDKTLTERDLQMAFKSLMNLEHPYIDKIVFMHSLETGAYVVRNVHPSGSVRDHLHNTPFASPYLAKYANPKQSRPFTTGQVAHYGYQILQALKYLQDKGLPYGHLHTGNLAIENQQVLLLDIENSLLGLPCYFRQFILEHKKINSMEAVDVFSFGHTIYEMAFGEPLNSSTCDNFPAYSTELVSVLEMILSSSACKRGLPTIDSLLLHPFFSYAPSIINGQFSELMKNCHLKFSVQTKEHLKAVAACVESRLKFDQKQVRADRRRLRIQEILSSEEELRKKKKKSKNKENATISHSQSSLNGFSPLSMSGPSERSGSAASTLSTASSPTPPIILEESPASKGPALSPSTSDPGRSAFLDSICSFNKNKLHKAVK